jgi:hypothetical protein
MTQDCWPHVGDGGTIPSPSTAFHIGRVKRHLTTNGGTAEWSPAETVNDVITTSAASPIERVKWPVTNTADRSLQNETMRPMDDHPLTGPRYHPTTNPREQLPIKVLRLNNGKRRKVGDTAPNRDAPPPPIIKENTPRMGPIQSHIPKQLKQPTTKRRAQLKTGCNHNPSVTNTNSAEDCSLISARKNGESSQ